MIKRFILILNILTISSYCITSFAQVNIEKIRSQNSEKENSLMFSGGLDFQKGNVDQFSLELETIFNKREGFHDFFIQLKSARETESKSRFKNENFSHLRWIWLKYKTVGPEVFIQVQHNEFKNLLLRQLNGAGIRYIPFVGMNNLTSGVSIMTDFEILSSKKKSLDLRLNSYISILKKRENNKGFIQLSSYYQPMIRNIKDYRLTAEFMIRSQIFSDHKLFIDNSFVTLYDSQPPESVHNLDVRLKLNLTYEW